MFLYLNVYICTQLIDREIQCKSKDLHHCKRKYLWSGKPSHKLKYSDQDSQSAFNIDDEMKRSEISSRIEFPIESWLPEHPIQGVDLKDNSSNKDKIGKLRPIVHSCLEMQQSKGKGEVDGWLYIGEGADGIDASSDEDAVEDNDEKFEDEDVDAHPTVIIRILILIKILFNLYIICPITPIYIFSNCLTSS